jgi:hypothetical protein
MIASRAALTHRLAIVILANGHGKNARYMGLTKTGLTYPGIDLVLDAAKVTFGGWVFGNLESAIAQGRANIP